MAPEPQASPPPEPQRIGEKQLWKVIDSLRESMGEHRGTGIPVWEAWCAENGIDWEDLRAAANAYLGSFKQWLDDSCLAEAAVHMWLHAYQVGFLTSRIPDPQQQQGGVEEAAREFERRAALDRKEAAHLGEESREGMTCLGMAQANDEAADYLRKHFDLPADQRGGEGS